MRARLAPPLVTALAATLAAAAALAACGTTDARTGDPAGAPASKPAADPTAPAAVAHFAGGCFWGVEHLLESVDGVIDVESGFMGGHVDRPTYRQVVYTDTGHAETVRVTYDPRRVSYEFLAKRFFEIHDPTEVDRQGPDVGRHYRSAIFYGSDEERAVAERLIARLRGLGYDVATELTPATTFWPAEADHQDYYVRTGKAPYCHEFVPRFDRRGD